MQSKFLLVLASTIFTAQAHAQVGFNQNGNNNGGTTAVLTSTSSNAQGGAGGQGGTGGTGLGLGVGLGGSATGGTSNAVTGASSSTGSTAVGSVSIGGDSYHSPEMPVSTAYAAPLTSGADSCMGSSSGGAQGPGFGLSIGTTWVDSNCIRLKNAKMMDGLGYRNVAIAMMCADATVAAAMRATGRVCPAAKEDTPSAQTTISTEPIYTLKHGGADLNDEFIRSRLTGTSAFSTK